MSNQPSTGNTLTKIFQKFIPDNIARSQTSVFWQLFSGFDAMAQQFETILKTFKKERNMLTANHVTSLRSLAAGNGFEPTLKTPATGMASIQASSALFNRVGFPLYLPPYAQFTETNSGLAFYYDSSKVLRIDNSAALLTLTEGEPQQQTQVSTGRYIERYYLSSDAVADGSIMVSVGSVQYLNVKSFFDSANLNGGLLFMVKFSNRADMPIVVYVMGAQLNDTVTIAWKSTAGEGGNLPADASFTTTDMITAQGLEVNPSSTEAIISVVSGFRLGSNGTDENALRAAIGFNHGVVLLFDTVSYTAFIDKFSTLLTQKVVPNQSSKQISNIYVSLKTYLNPNLSLSLQQQYQDIIGTGSWLVPSDQKTILDGLISANEYALSSHNLFDSETNSYALQVLFDTSLDQQANQQALLNTIYEAFSQFLWNSSWTVNLELLFDGFMTDNNVTFAWTVFSQSDEAAKLSTKAVGQPTSHVLTNIGGITPVLHGNFPIADQNMNPVQLFFDVNIVSQESLG
jgi:hypothetical protein